MVFIFLGVFFLWVIYWHEAMIVDSSPSPLTERKPGTAIFKVSVDCASRNSRINNNIFGAFTNPDEVKKSFELLKEARFRLIETAVIADERFFTKAHNIKDLKFIKGTEKHVERALDLGMEPMVWFITRDKPFKNLNAFSTYTKNILRYLTKGAMGGHHYNIRLFRFGNEPDNFEYWKGTKEEFFKTFEVWAKAVKSVDPHFIVVGPGVVFTCAATFDKKSRTFTFKPAEIGQWTKDFLEYCYKNKVPLDYFTVHGYTPVVYPIFNAQIKSLREYLKKFPGLSPLFGIPKIGNDEWNVMVGDQWSGKYNKEFDTVDLAAHNILVLINMIKSGLELSIRYGGTDFPGHDYTMVFEKHKPKPVFYAFKGFNMLQQSPIMLKDSSGNDLNIGILAGISPDSKKIVIVIANFDIDYYLNTLVRNRKGDTASIPKQFNLYKQALNALKITKPLQYGSLELSLDNIPWAKGDQVEYSVYSVDETHNLALISKKVIDATKTIRIAKDLPLPSVQILVFEKRISNADNCS
jgi:hypothetical protein